MKRLLAAVALLSAMALPARADDPSFDCAKATSPVEKTICDDNHAELALRDGAMGRILDALKSQGGHDAVLGQQQGWLEQRNACGTDADCLAKRYDERLKLLAKEAGDKLGLSGSYHYHLNDTDTGDAYLVREADGTLSGLVDTVTGKDSHACDIAFEGANPIGDAFVWDDPEAPEGSETFCRILLRPGNGGLRIDSDSCQSYCNEGGGFDQTYGGAK